MVIIFIFAVRRYRLCHLYAALRTMRVHIVPDALPDYRVPFAAASKQRRFGDDLTIFTNKPRRPDLFDDLL